MSNETTLIATSPKDMQEAQEGLIQWCDRKRAEVLAELREAEEARDIAARSKWATKPYDRIIARTQKRIDFYNKVKSALLAGYYIVPNFMFDAFAVRTDAKSRRGARKWIRGYANPPAQPVKLLPEGAGSYVNPDKFSFLPKVRTVLNNKGEEVEIEGKTILPDLHEPEFPMALAKPQVMAAAEQAMALKLFDEVGIARDWQRSGDPIIVGHIRNPRPSRPGVTFFVAWWLNYEDL